MNSEATMQPPPLPPSGEAQIKRITYSLTRWDILHWHIYILLRNRLIIGLGLMIGLALAWKDVHTPELAAAAVAAKVLYVVFLLGALFLLFGAAMLLVVTLTVVSKKFRGFLGEHELEVRDEGLVERTDINESLHRWCGFHEIIETGRYLYIYVTDNNAHIVPRRYFRSENEWRAFREEIERHIGKARQSSSGKIGELPTDRRTDNL